MPDMMQLLSRFQGFLQNNRVQNPQAAVQELLNSGRMSQQQFNQLRQMAQQIQANPAFRQMFEKK